MFTTQLLTSKHSIVVWRLNILARLSLVGSHGSIGGSHDPPAEPTVESIEGVCGTGLEDDCTRPRKLSLKNTRCLHE